MSKIFIISDLHFGMRANSIEWLEIQTDYFDNFFFPLLKEKAKPHDILFVLGDVFDNRQNVQILVQHTVINLFEKLSKIFKEIHVIVGNHDIFRKGSTEISSLSCIKHIPGIYVHSEVKNIKIDGKSIILMPWQVSHEDEETNLNLYSGSDYLFCHSEIQGVYLNRKVQNDKGMELDRFKGYGKVYSGHIHFGQKRGNVTFVGNPYEMTRSDMYNKKGIYVIELSTGEEIFYENIISPHFISVDLKDLYEKRLDEIAVTFKNNFVDLMIPNEAIVKYNISSFMNSIDSFARKIDPRVYDDSSTKFNMDMAEEYGDFDIMTVSRRFINETTYEVSLQERIVKKIEDLYKKINCN